MLGGVGDQTKASGSNPSASITVTRCPSRTASMAAEAGDGAQSDDGDMLACVLSCCAQQREAAMRRQ